MNENALLQSLFEQAVGLPAEKQAGFLLDNCPSDRLRARLVKLLKIHNESGSFLEYPLEERFRQLLDQPGDQIGDFQVTREIGRGGMSSVYLAKDMVLDREVALKILGADRALSGSARARFLHEARAAAGLKHPNIVQVYRYGDSDRHCYIAMEYISGGTLDRWLARRDRSSAKDRKLIVEVMASLCDALEHAHRAGVIHRDVKPANVLMGAGHRPMLVDFGIARMRNGDPAAETLAGAGTAAYMSPEQIGAVREEIDHRSDVFSLGVVLYEALCGVRPFDGDTPAQVMETIRNEDPRRPRAVSPSLSRDLETICLKAIEKQPNDRYQSAAHVAADLRSYLADRPILARRPSLARRARRFASRHRTLFMSAIIIALVAISSLTIGLLYEARRADIVQVSLMTGKHQCQMMVEPMGQVLQDSSPKKYEKEVRSTINLPRGQYRVTVERVTDGAFAEFNVVVLNTGRDHDRNIIVVDPNEPWPKLGPRDLCATLTAPADVAENMIRVDGGEYLLGPSGGGNSFLAPAVLITSFLIDSYEVTNKEYHTFVDATGYPAPHHWELSSYDEKDAADLPVIWVTFEDAEAYARWRGKRLPTYSEWQAAARGSSGTLYPGGSNQPPIGEPAAASTSDQDEDYYQSYLAGVDAVRVLAPWDLPNGLAHTHSNVLELTATVDLPHSDVIVAGRAWSDSLTRSLDELRATKIFFPGPRMGFRCAKSLTSFTNKGGSL